LRQLDIATLVVWPQTTMLQRSNRMLMILRISAVAYLPVIWVT
jgi:hypothetical protein